MNRASANCRRGRRGFALFHVMLVVALFSAFVVVAAKMLRTTMRISAGASAASVAGSRVDGAVGQLRRDAWGAASLAVADARTLRIERPGEAPMTWSITEQ